MGGISMGVSVGGDGRTSFLQMPFGAFSRARGGAGDGGGGARGGGGRGAVYYQDSDDEDAVDDSPFVRETGGVGGG